LGTLARKDISRFFYQLRVRNASTSIDHRPISAAFYIPGIDLYTASPKLPNLPLAARCKTHTEDKPRVVISLCGIENKRKDEPAATYVS